MDNSTLLLGCIMNLLTFFVVIGIVRINKKLSEANKQDLLIFKQNSEWIGDVLDILHEQKRIGKLKDDGEGSLPDLKKLEELFDKGKNE